MLIFVKNDDCVSYKMTFHHVFIYLDLVCILYPVCSLQSAVCSLHFVLTDIGCIFFLSETFSVIPTRINILSEKQSSYLRTALSCLSKTEDNNLKCILNDRICFSLDRQSNDNLIFVTAFGAHFSLTVHFTQTSESLHICRAFSSHLGH